MAEFTGTSVLGLQFLGQAAEGEKVWIPDCGHVPGRFHAGQEGVLL